MYGLYICSAGACDIVWAGWIAGMENSYGMAAGLRDGGWLEESKIGLVFSRRIFRSDTWIFLVFSNIFVKRCHFPKKTFFWL